MTKKPKKNFLQDLNYILQTAENKKYLFHESDAFILGYICGKYDINDMLDFAGEIPDNDSLTKEFVKAIKKEFVKAIKEYDKTDELVVLDTVAETLIDLDFITEKELE